MCERNTNKFFSNVSRGQNENKGLKKNLVKFKALGLRFIFTLFSYFIDLIHDNYSAFQALLDVSCIAVHL